MDATFVKTIKVDAKILKRLSQRSNAHGWVQTAGHLSAIALNSALLAEAWSASWAVWWIALFFLTQGILINCLYAGVHELSHNSVFKTRNLNEFFGRLFCFVLLMGRDQDKFEHYQHHRHTMDLELDAEIVGSKPFTLPSWILYMSGISYWPSRISEVVRLALGHTNAWPHLSETQFKMVHREARLNLLGYSFIFLISVITSSSVVLMFWLLPMFATKSFHLLQNTVEHLGMPHEDDILINTRTVQANPLMRRLFWNMPFHTAHHSYPMIPFYNLSELHGEIVSVMDGQEPPTVSHFAFQRHMFRKLAQEGTSSYTGQDITAY